jgi:hypothetical protein
VQNGVWESSDYEQEAKNPNPIIEEGTRDGKELEGGVGGGVPLNSPSPP